MKKLTAKLVAIILSLLMVITTLPISVFAADSNYDAAVTAYNDYIAKMNGTTLYTNMYNAYSAFLAIEEAIDDYKYGDGTSTQLATATTNLNNAMNNMSEYSGLTITENCNTFANNSYGTGYESMTAIKSYAYQNVIYTDPTNVSAAVCSNQPEQYYTFKIYYASSVLVLDGKSTPKIPVMAQMVGDKTGKTRYAYGIYPYDDASTLLDSEKMVLTGPWLSLAAKSCTNLDYTWLYDQVTNQGKTSYSPGYNYGTGCYSSSLGISNQNANRRSDQPYYKSGAIWYKTTNSMENALRIADDYASNTFTDTKYSDNFTLNWYADAAENPNSSGSQSYMSTSTNIYTINMKPLVQYLENASNTQQLNVSNYKFGGLEALLAAYDDATSFDVTTYFNNNGTDAATKTTNTGNRIKAIYEALNNASRTAVEGSGYVALRSAFSYDRTVDGVKQYSEGSAKAKYNNGTNSGYTAESYATLKTAYENAYNMMAALPTTAYSNSALAQQYADALEAALNGLEIDFDPVDVTNLKIAIDNANVAIENASLFTTSSYAQADLSTLVNNAISVVWQGGTYGNDALLLPLNETNTAKVTTHTNNIVNAIAKLQFNDNAISYSTYSLNSAISYAQTTYLNDSEFYDTYANAATLTSAVNNATTYISNRTTLVGSEENNVQTAIDQYKDYTASIIRAINGLKRAFSKLVDGSIVKYGVPTETQILPSKEVDSGATSYRWTLRWKHPDGVVLFKTNHEDATYNLGSVNFEWYTSEGTYPAFLDAITLMDSWSREADDLSDVGEMTPTQHFSANQGSLTGISTPLQESFNTLNTNVNNDNPTALSLKVTNCILDFSELKVTSYANVASGGVVVKSNGTSYKDDSCKNVNVYSDLAYFDDYAGGKIDNCVGGVNTKGGAVNIGGSWNITPPTLPQKAVLNTTTKPVYYDVSPSGNLGMMYAWAYCPGGVVNFYNGYSHDRATWDAHFSVIDVSYLFDLIGQCNEIAKSGEDELYTVESWTNFEAAIASANGSLDYDNMTGADMGNEVKARYDNLLAARKALVKCANNISLKNAISATKDTYDAGNLNNVNYTAASWSAFTSAYEGIEAVLYGTGTYSSPTNIRSHLQSEQTTIDALAQSLLDAYAGLIGWADFSGLDTAVNALVTGISDNTYSVSSLNTLKDTIDSLTYYKYNDATRAATPEKDGSTDIQAAIDAEATNIATLTSILATVDASAYDSAIASAAGAIDLDAYNSDTASKISAIDIYSPVDFNNYKGTKIDTVSGVAVASQEDLDSQIAGILSDATNTRSYTVSVKNKSGANVSGYTIKDKNGKTYTNGATVPYGTELTITGADSDWYYGYTSITGTTNVNTDDPYGSFLKSGTSVDVVVKGATTLTVLGSSQTNTVKVTYVNGVNMVPFDIQYVTTGTAFNASSVTAPTMAYYTFSRYNINWQEIPAGYTFTEDTTVVAMYDQTTSGISLKLHNLDNSLSDEAFEDDDENEIVFNYNDKISFVQSSYQPSKKAQNGTFTINDKVYELYDKRAPKETQVFAWVALNTNTDTTKLDTVIGSLEDGSISDFSTYTNLAHVVGYGTDFEFYLSEDVVLYALSEDQYDYLIYNGVISNGQDNENKQNDGCSVYLNKSGVVTSTGKFSIISSYLIGADCTLIENGVVLSTDSSISDDNIKVTYVDKSSSVYRLKSSKSTSTNNQFVINIKSSGTKNIKYRSYSIYKDSSGKIQTVYSDVMTETVTIG